MSINMLCFGYQVAVYRQAVKKYLAPSAHGKNTVDLRSLDTWRNLLTGKRQRKQISHIGCPTGEQPRMWLGPGNKALILILVGLHTSELCRHWYLWNKYLFHLQKNVQAINLHIYCHCLCIFKKKEKEKKRNSNLPSFLSLPSKLRNQAQSERYGYKEVNTVSLH